MDGGATVRLLIAASALMLVAGCIFGFIQQWTCTVLLLIGAFGCAVAALNFKNRNDK